MIRQWLIRASRRLLRAVLLRLAQDTELIQSVQAGISSSAFVRTKLLNATAVYERDDLLIKSLERAPRDGLICEFGVYKGHTLRLIASVSDDRLVYGFDSFEGLPETWRAGYLKGAFRIESSKIPAAPKNVKIYQGMFNDTLPHMLRDDTRDVAFLHIDCDLYSSTKCVFDYLSKKLCVGTVIVFDEYFNFPGWENDEHRALLEAAQDAGFLFEYLFYNPVGQQVSIVVTSIRAD